MLEGAVAAARGGVVREADGRAVFIGLGSRGMDVVHLLLFRGRGLVACIYRNLPVCTRQGGGVAPDA